MKHWEAMLARRQFLASASAGAVTLYMSGCTSRSGGTNPDAIVAPLNKNDWLRDYGPVNRTIGDVAPKVFSGDDFSFPHPILWDIPKYMKDQKIPEPEHHDVVIIGGGASGVFTAYCLREYKPIILEQAARFGGNAKAESWRGMDYSIGAAYIDHPAPGSAMERFYNELNWKDLFTERPDADPVEADGKLYARFWEGETEISKAEKQKYLRIEAFFKKLCAAKDEPFPFIPTSNPAELKAVRHYDQWSIHELLTKVAGGKLPKRLEIAIEHYCWSTYAASSKELSAAAALNFLAQESDPICVAAGGNSRLVERTLDRILDTVPTSHLRPRSLAVDVRVEGDGVRVLYADAKGQLHHIKARAVVMSCPKFVVNKIAPDIAHERGDAIAKLKYRAYMTANLLVNQKLPENIYDVFLTGNGKSDFSDVKHAQELQNATDFVIGNFSARGKDFGVLTFYRAFPHDVARNELIQPTTYDIYKQRFEKQIKEQILPLMKIDPKNIQDLRLTRWGHALPLAATGLYQGDTIERLRRPHRDRVFFVEQDNWGYPATETGATEAVAWEGAIRKLLGKPTV